MATDPVLSFTPNGIYCADGAFYIDPLRPVDRALITHAHADHARSGHGAYLCTPATLPILRHRLGEIHAETLPYGARQRIGGVEVSFHPAGHVPGSAQIRVARGGEIWVVSGDYKIVEDGLSEPFEPVRCHHFITECTFGLPAFQWPDQTEVAAQINGWWAQAQEAGQTPVLTAYSLGKAQRILRFLNQRLGPVLAHGAIEATNNVLRAQGIALPPTLPIAAETQIKDHPGALILAPPAALNSTWARRFGPVTTGFASGWMALRGVRRRRGADRGFVLSDHADWPGLNQAIKDTGAENIIVTHGYTEIFRQWLEGQGYKASILPTHFQRDEAGGEDG